MFVFFSEFIVVSVVWWCNDKVKLGKVYLAFVVAVILFIIVALYLWYMIEVSGIRFALMSPVYPTTPGLLMFGVTFLVVMIGLLVIVTWGLFFILLLCVVGAISMFRWLCLLGIIVIF